MPETVQQATQQDEDEQISRHKALLEIDRLVQEGEISMSKLSPNLKQSLKQSRDVLKSSVKNKHKTAIIEIGNDLPDGYQLVINSDRTAEVKQQSSGTESSGDSYTSMNEQDLSVDMDEDTSAMDVDEDEVENDKTPEIPDSYKSRGFNCLEDLTETHLNLFNVVRTFIEDGEPVPSARELSSLTDIAAPSVSRYLMDLMNVGLIYKPKGSHNSSITLTNMGENADFFD